ncbi:MAG: spore coat protein CotJB [Eubacteriales bacterium]
MNCPEVSCNSNRPGANLLKKIQEIDFSLYETILYLDVYPDCLEALCYYHTLMSQRRELMEQYTCEVGPLTAFENRSRTCWDWVKSPWPWQM